MDDNLKELMKNLGEAINDSLSDSDLIVEAIGEIKRAGYDVFLIFEITIGFDKRGQGDNNGEESPVPLSPPIIKSEDLNGVRVNWNSQDQKFLRTLKIKLE